MWTGKKGMLILEWELQKWVSDRIGWLMRERERKENREIFGTGGTATPQSRREKNGRVRVSDDRQKRR